MIQIANQQKLVFAWGVVLLVVRTTNLLSLFVEWVKLFPDSVTRGEKMKKWMLAIFLMFINEICQATD
ncbi:lytic transglycosylase, partial [Salmonella enterica]|nr:lytic transglycosylase [Salmonella enterica]EDY6202326.1 lytic transglycosylase [Salmonella enterica]EIM2583157.1 lytic transglycosylase [Salmonella enterica]EIO8907717.1 lytic transglycosylase [Salmonella enterica]EKM4843284.1 lytic transglycosylase [Salmonella enterica]